MAPYDADVTQTSFDKEAATKELAAAGITTVKCITYSNARPYNAKGGQVLAESIQGYLKDCGVTVTIDTYDWTTYKTKIQTEAYDISFYGWTGDNGDPDNFMLGRGRNFVFSAPYTMIYPGLAITFTVLAFNLLGDGIRDAFDPKSRRR